LNDLGTGKGVVGHYENRPTAKIQKEVSSWDDYG